MKFLANLRGLIWGPRGPKRLPPPIIDADFEIEDRMEATEEPEMVQNQPSLPSSSADEGQPREAVSKKTKKTGGFGARAAGWSIGIAVGLLIIAVLGGVIVGITTFFGGDKKESAESIVSSKTERSAAESSSEERFLTVVARQGEPGTVEVPPNWRWDLRDLSLTQYTTEGVRDSRGYRIQTFWVQAPLKEINLPIKLTKCTTAAMCAW